MPTIEKISSRENARLIAARKVRDGKDRSRMLIEGTRLVFEALSSGLEVEQCFLSDQLSNAGLRDAVLSSGAAVAELPERVFRTICDTETPQGAVIIAKRPETTRDDFQAIVRKEVCPLIVLLSRISNPSNLGAILRTAEAAGVTGVIVSAGSADAFSTKSLRAAMGSAFRMPIWSGPETDDVITWASGLGITTRAADAEGVMEHFGMNWTLPVLVGFGSEAHGFSRAEIERFDSTFRISMEGEIESLNLAVSAGVILFEAKRQREASRS